MAAYEIHGDAANIERETVDEFCLRLANFRFFLHVVEAMNDNTPEFLVQANIKALDRAKADVIGYVQQLTLL